MSATADASTLSASDSHAHDGKFHVFVQLAMILAIITGMELLVIYIPMPEWLVISILMGLSVVKFLAVIFIFMHLKWDKAFCTILFFIGLALGGGTLWALLLLHGAKDSQPVGPAYEMVE
ncbi:cytochrome C oxidase subunit IV family protein [Actomonas aquatica]|uniref:Cytochrome C oxidase subunit IV family protein n=1 Tax=Actomonas aquatica TaxID=2866162 RepID=A0ABZ1C7Z1_9BACT|nr:cytochrome C oxidase subunit IV family protein [Opitutus sp. WL0086]WRQ87573.1 cytochrome C oxidase subunit IV family protein [Opitutus sp. WL0086]